MKKKYTTSIGKDVTLDFCTKVLKLNSLHYGYWDKKEELNFENLRKAQARYTDYLTSLIPKEVISILDIGCGIGDNSIGLAKKGYTLTAVSPDPNHQLAFEEITKRYSKVNFILSRYEDLNLDKKYDLILMSESSNYFPVEAGLSQTKKFLKPGGYLLILGLFRKGDTDEYSYMNILPKYIQEADGYGLKLIKQEDMTDQITPTNEFGTKTYNLYLKPSIEIFFDYLNGAKSLKIFLLKLIFHREISQLVKLLDKQVKERFDSEKFKKYANYIALLFQKLDLHTPRVC